MALAWLTRYQSVLGITLSPSDAHIFVFISTFIIMLSLHLGWYIQRCEEGHFCWRSIWYYFTFRAAEALERELWRVVAHLSPPNFCRPGLDLCRSNSTLAVCLLRRNSTFAYRSLGNKE
ncbi:hypothetical protein FVEG_14738 [Fusarium verticillioides 7600]|uniref:Uncharacterized protein n=1 Tax=Gibberella moniliformis (strain M3125 / FGSC 7600) TaxID=334819 RepID=W7LEJ9_GIBM7|nr:hypothetical protein FVEG_14738 [Fusarium verticillioides 7600]EWG37001.1 hypothetical protein FVEG_14738 [Fusarium verticillioides 7600]